MEQALQWPFFEEAHRELWRRADAWADEHLRSDAEPTDLDAACKALVRALGAAGWLRYVVPARYGGSHESLDVRSLCILRETFAARSALADFLVALQGLGAVPIALFGAEALRESYLPRIAAGSTIAAFAVSEPDAGSDVAAIATVARRDRDEYVLDGVKTWISNGGIADLYVLFARTGEAPGARGISAFAIDADTPGLRVEERIETIAPHPLARLRLQNCRVAASRLLGTAGEGFKVAMQTLDVFRSSVAAAANGFARRALQEAVRHVRGRRMFGQTLADFQLTQAALGDMAADVDASALLTYRAAWLRDGGAKVTREAAMAKMVATESAQRVIDRAVQLFGGFGVTRGYVVERLYREIRALRIYEGATEIQRLIVGRDVLAAAEQKGA